MWCPGHCTYFTSSITQRIVFLLVGTNYRVGCFVLKSYPWGMIFFFPPNSPAHYLHLQGDSYNVIGGLASTTSHNGSYKCNWMFIINHRSWILGHKHD
jgi:hypothetical protein